MRPGCGRPGLVPVEVLLRSFLIVEPGPSWWVSKSRYSSHIVTRFIAWICWPVSAGSKEASLSIEEEGAKGVAGLTLLSSLDGHHHVGLLHGAQQRVQRLPDLKVHLQTKHKVELCEQSRRLSCPRLHMRDAPARS